MKKPVSPCAKDCENRTITCHGECERYLQYEKERNEYYKEVQRIKMGMPPGYAKAEYLDKLAKEKRRRPKKRGFNE